MISRLRPLPPSFYLRPVLQVAPSLLGKLLVRRIGRKILIGRIVEVEAYRQDDPASHSYKGRTQRNEVMFRAGGLLYVYFTYGMHFCTNVVTGPEGRAEAVLLRAVEPLLGIEEMAIRRYGRRAVRSQKELLQLASGPARLCQAFDIGRKENGVTLEGPDVFIADDGRPSPRKIRSRRIGITNGKEKLWRWIVNQSEWISRPQTARSEKS